MLGKWEILSTFWQEYLNFVRMCFREETQVDRTMVSVGEFTRYLMNFMTFIVWILEAYLVRDVRFNWLLLLLLSPAGCVRHPRAPYLLKQSAEIT